MWSQDEKENERLRKENARLLEENVQLRKQINPQEKDYTDDPFPHFHEWRLCCIRPIYDDTKLTGEEAVIQCQVCNKEQIKPILHPDYLARSLLSNEKPDQSGENDKKS